MKKFAILFIGALFLLTSCEETESPIYDQVNGQTLVSFDATSSSSGILPGQTVTNTININVSKKSSSARTVTISVNENSTSGVENYTIPTSFTIPADSYFSSFDVVLNDSSLGLTPSTIIINLDTVDDGGNTTTDTHTISAFELAPLTGSYLIEQTSALIDGPTLADGTVVEISYVSPTERSFLTTNYPAYCATDNEFTFTLVGGVTGDIVADAQDSNCPCSSGAGWFGPAAGTNGTYDFNDDSEFFLIFSDDVQADCGPAQDTTYKFTKQ